MKDKPLTVEIVDGELRISIGIGTLKFSTENSPDTRLNWFDEDLDDYVGYKVSDEEEFARDVKNALNAEEEDGTTPLHTVIDNACVTAIEEGSLGMIYEPSPVKW
jgi:hypothetical protein